MFDPLKNAATDPKIPEIPDVRTIEDVNSIGFEWDSMNSESVAGFGIAKQNADKSFDTIAIIKNPFATHFHVDGLAAVTPYTFAFYTIGRNKKISAPKIINTKTSFLDPIENIFASTTLPKQIKVFFSPHSNPSVTGYVIQRETKNGFFESIAEVTNRLFVEYFDKNLGDSVVKRYRVLAKNSNGTLSLPSKIVEGKTRPKPDPINYIVASYNLKNAIQIAWNEPLNPVYKIKYFKIFASDHENGKFREIGQSNQNTFRERDLNDAQVRWYKVSVVDVDGVQSELYHKAFRGQAIPLPDTPQIKSQIVRNGAVIITWDVKSSRNFVYSVCKTKKDENERTCFDNIIKKGFIDRDVQKATQYVYEIFSHDTKNDLKSEPSRPVRVEI